VDEHEWKNVEELARLLLRQVIAQEIVARKSLRGAFDRRKSRVRANRAFFCISYLRGRPDRAKMARAILMAQILTYGWLAGEKRGAEKPAARSGLSLQLGLKSDVKGNVTNPSTSSLYAERLYGVRCVI